MANQVTINSSTNGVSVNQSDKIVTIAQPSTTTVEVFAGPQGAKGSVGAPGASNPLDEYVFVLDTNNGFTLTGSAAPQSTIVVTDMEGNTFRHTPTEFDFPNANEMFVEGNTIWVGYNWAFRVYDSSSLESTYKLVRLEDVVVDFSSSTLSYNVAENIYLTSGSQNFSQAHGNDMSENYIFLTSRGSNGDNNNTGFQVARINKYDFTDIQLYQTPVNSDFGDGEVCRYYNGNLYVGCNRGYTQLKISRFNAFDLYDNELLITGPSGRIGPPGVLEIYKNQIFTTTDYRKSGVDLLKYDLNGNLLAQNRIYPITGSGEYSYEFNIPHASTIKDNHWYITQIYSYASLLKVDIDTLELVDSIVLEADKQASPTDDITIGQDGNLWIGTEDNEFIPADERAIPKIYKVTTDNLEVTEIATLNKSSFGSFSIKNQILRDQYKPFTYNFNGTYVGDLITSGSITSTEPRITLDSLNESGSLLIGRPSQALDPGFGYLAAGVDSLVSIISASDTDGASVAFGDYALSQSIDGPNTAFGYGALAYLGSDDQFWGVNGQGPFYNTAVGVKSAQKWLGNTSTFIGEFSGPYFNYAYGRYNIGIGAQSLLRLSGSSTDNINENSAVGIGSLIDLRQGNNNTALGTLSAQKLQFGDNNIVVGSKLLDLTSGSNNLIIGSLNTLGLGNFDNNIIFTDNSAIRYRFDGTDTTIYSDLITSGSLNVSGSTTINDVLTLTPQDPLPSGTATGSFAVSSSVPPKPYFFDGTNWNALY